jgi:hypothetical protein
VLDLAYPFDGRWLTQNSPTNRVPSHGTTRFASAFAIDFVPVDADGRSAPFRLASMLMPEASDRFTGFGRPILAPISGRVVAVHDGEPDHDAYRGLPSVGYALTQARRAARGWSHLAGNHVMIEGQNAVVALCHLQRGSIVVEVGARVAVGEQIGCCGNSGNSTEPHVHLQVMDGTDASFARALPFTLNGAYPPQNGRIVEPG